MPRSGVSKHHLCTDGPDIGPDSRRFRLCRPYRDSYDERKYGTFEKKTLKSLVEKDSFRENVRNDRGGKGNPVDITDNYIAELVELM